MTMGVVTVTWINVGQNVVCLNCFHSDLVMIAENVNCHVIEHHFLKLNRT